MNKEQAFLLVVLLLSSLVSLAIVLPFLEFVLLAIILAYLLHPVNERVEPYLGRRLGPIAVITGATLALILPFAYVGLVLYRDLTAWAAAEPDLDIAAIERLIAEITGRDVHLTTYVETAGADLLQVLFGDVTELVSRLVLFMIGMLLLFFLVYYLLRDGEAFVEWLISVAPAEDQVCVRLIDQVDRTTHGVIVGHLFVAIVQGILGGIGFWIAGIPNVVFWAFVMGLLALLPLIGPIIVWVPAVGYLFLVDELAGAVFLAVWGTFVISMVDNYARPIVIDRGAHLNPAVILVGVFGGIYAIGMTGLFVGPIILGVLAASVQVFDEEWDRIGGPTGGE